MYKTIKRLFSVSKRTPLYDFHVESKAKMVDFAGYLLPVQYSSGIIKEHLHCRSSASIFDVSHMGQISITGIDRVRLLQRTTVGSVKRKSRLDSKINQAYLTMFLNEKAGIIDDCIAVNDQASEKVRLVVNGSNKYQVLSHLIEVTKKEIFDVKINLFQDELGLIALQGPQAAQALQPFIKNLNLSQLPFMSQFQTIIDDQQIIISRSGYTGQDGFQISASKTGINSLVRKLILNQKVGLAGLGARDSLRLQAGLCLHGNDITPSITPFEANLMWTVHKRGITSGDRLNFIGQEALRNQVDDVKSGIFKIRKRVGFTIEGSGIVRSQCRILNQYDQDVGITSSGIYSPYLKKCVGMAYIDQDLASVGNRLSVDLRGKKLPLVIEKMPFVKPNYYKNWSKFD